MSEESPHVNNTDSDGKLEMSDGTVMWFLNGNYHRIGGPAFISKDGKEKYYMNGRLHRSDGPAMLDHYNEPIWAFAGERLSFNEWIKYSTLSEVEKAELVLLYG